MHKISLGLSLLPLYYTRWESPRLVITPLLAPSELHSGQVLGMRVEVVA